jgi:hypothetical protein
MTVAELIKQLQMLPPDGLVIAEGYEDGYDTIKKVLIIPIEENQKKEWYVGKYIDSDNPDALVAVFLDAENKAEK